MSVLAELVEAARDRARRLPREDAPRRPVWMPSFAEALRGRDRLAVVAEFKRASPTEGSIAERDLAEQVRRYVEAGAAALSVLTEPHRFGGSYEDLALAAATARVPVLMKDFVVDVAQIRHAARLGAAAVLLIVRCLDDARLDELADACHAYGLVPLVECHDEGELDRALRIAGAVVGVNNRDLDTLRVDRDRGEALLERIPVDRIALAESGYERPSDARRLVGRADAVLVGTALMRAPDPAAWIREVSR